ncbi:MAG: alpha/beta hydrolase [Pseudomonadota bacterium]
MTWLRRLATRMDTAGAVRKTARFQSGWASRSRQDVRFYSTPKVTYRYREHGDGPTIVFAADPPVTLEMYDELFAKFTPKYRVIVMELPGMGFSVPATNFTFRWRETNDDVAQFLRDVAGDGIILAFSCVAGLAAVDLAVRYPELVNKLVLMQTADVAAFQRWKAARDPKRILAKPFIGQFVMKRLAPKRMPDWFALSVGDKSKVPSLCACSAESMRHGAMWSLASAYQSYMDPNVNLGRPQQPTLALWGLADGSHPPGNEVSAKGMSDNVVYRAFPALGHFSELEDTEQVYDVIDAFVEGRLERSDLANGS